MINLIRKLYEHMWWADDRMLDAYDTAKVIAEPAVGVLAHVVAAEAVWLARLEHREADVRVWPDLDPAQTRTLADETQRRFSDYLNQLRDEDLDTACTYTNSAGDTFTTPVIDILMHVALHGSYHRGQLASALRAGGDAPPITDYIEFVRNAPTARRDD